jgi:hypothetical protein
MRNDLPASRLMPSSAIVTGVLMRPPSRNAGSAASPTQGELWRDVRWSERVLIVERALSGDVEGPTKGRRVPLRPA